MSGHDIIPLFLVAFLLFDCRHLSLDYTPTDTTTPTTASKNWKTPTSLPQKPNSSSSSSSSSSNNNHSLHSRIRVV